MADSTRLVNDHSAAADRGFPGHIGPSVLRRGWEAICLLLEAHRYAQELGRDVWDFAVEIDGLRQAGCTNNEFRWLVWKGYVQYAAETTTLGASRRVFRRGRRGNGQIFDRKTCFILTAEGLAFAAATLDQWPAPVAVPAASPRTAGQLLPPAAAKPKWDRERQELRVGNVVVKQFKVPAANQERILAAFEEDGWPPHIDDPLPPTSDQDSKRRLHDTVNSLNRNQRQPLLHFLGDGTGQGVRWELTVPPAPPAPRGHR